MVGRHVRLNRDEFGQAPGVGDGPEVLEYYSAMGHKQSAMRND